MADRLAKKILPSKTYKLPKILSKDKKLVSSKRDKSPKIINKNKLPKIIGKEMLLLMKARMPSNLLLKVIHLLAADLLPQQLLNPLPRKTSNLL